ncbi:hypothetical protein PMAYCL1PPCAC_08333, partial [Pristionchus mayeri]
VMRRKLEALKSNDVRAHFCTIHIADRQKHRPSETVPYLNPTGHLTEAVGMNASVNVDLTTQLSIRNPSIPIENYVNCHLCYLHTPFYRIAPNDPIEARKFISSIRELNIQQINTVRRFLKLPQNGLIVCLNHFECSRMCDLCGEQTMKCYCSPVQSSHASAFFSRLIELTPQQRAKTELYIKQERSAIVCPRHFPLKNQVEPLTDNSPAIQRVKVRMIEPAPIDDGSNEEWMEEPGPSR